MKNLNVLYWAIKFYYNSIIDAKKVENDMYNAGFYNFNNIDYIVTCRDLLEKRIKAYKDAGGKKDTEKFLKF